MVTTQQTTAVQMPTKAVAPDNLPAGHAGYYNPHRFPVTFTSNFSSRGPATIEPGEPVTDGQGMLVFYDPDLERQVTDKMLKRILPADSRYKDFMKAQKQAAKRPGVVTVAATQAPVGPKIIEDEEEDDLPPQQPFNKTQTQPLPTVDYMEEEVDGVKYFVYQGKRFSSLSAMQVYISTLSNRG